MKIFERWNFGLCWNFRLVIELWYLEGFWFLVEDFFEDYIFVWWNIWIFIFLLLPYYTFKCKWQDHNVTHPLLDYLITKFAKKIKIITNFKDVQRNTIPLGLTLETSYFSRTTNCMKKKVGYSKLVYFNFYWYVTRYNNN